MTGERTGLSGFTDALIRLLSILAAAGIFALMALVFASVFFRYALNDPIIATEDIMAMLLGLTIFSAIPGVTLSRSHIRVELLTGPFHRWPKADGIRLAVIDIGVVLVTLYMARCVYGQAVRYMQRQTGSALMDWPLHPITYLFAALLVFSALIFAANAFRNRSRPGESMQ